ncbi:ALBINO3-like protein 2, chloroplastic isoform X1 [Aristolochia californica]|uniref:ALBINO3-like protein 2, chloroplastic isoform X1 n=1 Tax=Aristolochia californica TaxID=171875 RepID=UPI0035E0D78A
MGREKLLLELRRFSSSSLSRLSSRVDAFQNPRSLSSSIYGGYHQRLGGKFYLPSVRNCLHQAACLASVRSFSWASPTESTVDDNDSSVGSGIELESPSLGFPGLELVEEAAGDMKWYSPVRAVILCLDGYHDLSGFPWWVIIASSTLALRLSLLPVLILQLKKLERLSALIPKLPPPFPPPFSGRSYRKQFLFFQKQRRAIGCPSPLWSFAAFLVQVPCFVLWMISIRRMSLNHHPGFDTGGALWFQNLTEFPHGILAPVFPLLIAGLHFINVQISFKTSTIRSSPGIIGLLAKYYKIYLDILTIPIFLIGFYVPQGSLVYWVTNSSLNAVQQLSLRNPYIRQKLGLHATNPPTTQDMTEGSNKKSIHKLGLQASSVSLDPSTCAEDLPPDELFGLALQHLATGNQENAFPLLRLASKKDPELEERTSLAMGLFLLSKGSHMEAAECFEQSISKIKDDEVTNLVIAYYGAGFSHILQGRRCEGIELLKRIAELKEPENPMDKFCYFQGLVILGSTLFNEGQKAEALKYLRIAAAFDPTVNKYIEECERAEG